MSLTLSICSLTGLLVFLSVLFKPNFYVGKIKLGTYWVISLLGAVLLLLFGCVPLSYLAAELTASTAVNPLKILVLFFSMTALSVFLDEVGFFRYLAGRALKKAGHGQITLFVTLYAVVSVLTVFTSNDIVVLTFTPFICFFAKSADINPMPYLFAEFVASNTWSMLFIIGNPTNIYLATAAGIDFVTYALHMALPTLLAGGISFVVLFLLFHRDLQKPIHVTPTEVHITDRHALFLGVEHLGLCTVLLAISSYISFDMYLIAALFAMSLFLLVTACDLIEKKPLLPLVSTLKRLPFSLIPFVLSMFVLVSGMNYSGVTAMLSSWLVDGASVFRVGIASFLTANVINNIPMSVLFGSILLETAGEAGYLANVYAAVIGSNIGALFTPVGALAGIMWASILRRLGVSLSFKRFVCYGALVSIPALLASLLGLSLLMA